MFHMNHPDLFPELRFITLKSYVRNYWVNHFPVIQRVVLYRGHSEFNAKYVVVFDVPKVRTIRNDKGCMLVDDYNDLERSVDVFETMYLEHPYHLIYDSFRFVYQIAPEKFPLDEWQFTSKAPDNAVKETSWLLFDRSIEEMKNPEFSDDPTLWITGESAIKELPAFSVGNAAEVIESIERYNSPVYRYHSDTTQIEGPFDLRFIHQCKINNSRDPAYSYKQTVPYLWVKKTHIDEIKDSPKDQPSSRSTDENANGVQRPVRGKSKKEKTEILWNGARILARKMKDDDPSLTLTHLAESDEVNRYLIEEYKRLFGHEKKTLFSTDTIEKRLYNLQTE